MPHAVPLSTPQSFAAVVDPEAGVELKLMESPLLLLSRDDGIRELTQAIYTALTECRIRYALEPIQDNPYTQNVRTTGELLYSSQGGTCVDLATLFCGICLTYELLPVLILLESPRERHALVAVSQRFTRREWDSENWRRLEPWDSSNAMLRQEECAPFLRLVEQQHYLVVECTGFASSELPGEYLPDGIQRKGGFLSFGAACHTGSTLLRQGPFRLQCALDIETLHHRGYAPALPPPSAYDSRLATALRAQVRWQRWEENERAYRFQTDHKGHEQGPEAPLLPFWNRLLTAPPWHERVRQAISQVTSQLAKVPQVAPRFEPLLSELRTLRLTEPYPNICSRVAAIDLAKSRQELKREQLKQRKMRKETQAWEVDPQRLQDMLDSLEVLELLVRAPAYRRVLPVLGARGSGKSHFMFSQLGRSPRSGERVRLLILQPSTYSPALPIEDWILTTLRHMTRIHWGALEQVDMALKQLREKVVVALDDFHHACEREPELQRSLPAFIERHTHLHQFYWFVSLLDTRYEAVGLESEAWLRLGCDSALVTECFEGAEPTAPVVLSGWLVLDALNAHASLGNRLIEQQVDGQVKLVDEEMELSTRQSLASPFMAWILIEMARSATRLPLQVLNLRYIDFVEKFWEQRRRIPLPRELEWSDLEKLMQGATWLLIRSGAQLVAEDELARVLTEVTPPESVLRSRTLVREAVRALISASLVKRCEVAPPSEYREQGPVEGIQYQHEAFWYWRAAKALLTTPVERKKDYLREFEHAVQDNHHRQVTEGIWEFTVLLLDSRLQQGVLEPAQMRQLLRQVLGEQRRGLRAATWFAVAKASKQSQQVMVELLSAQPVSASSRHDVFGMLYFAGDARETDPIGLLQLLQPHFKAIAEYSLRDYYLFVASHLIVRLSEARDTARAISRCIGAEMMGVEQELACFAMEQLSLRCETLEEQLDWMMREICVAREHPGKERARKKGLRRSFRGWLFHELCEALVALKGLGAFELLKERGWFQEQKAVSPTVKLEMSQEGNLSLGQWYRRQPNRPNSGREAYEALIRRLLASDNAKDREQSFYLIKHTVPTHGRQDVRVNEKFTEFLRRLYRDPHPVLRALRKREQVFFTINLRLSADQAASDTISSGPRRRKRRPRGGRR